MKVSELEAKLAEHKARYGDTVVRFYLEKDGLDEDLMIDTVYPVNIHTADKPVWCCMLSD